MEGILVTFTVLIIIGVVLEVSFFSDGYAQRLHDRTIYVITNQSSSLRNISQILVGDMPSAIGVDSDTHTVYVANSGSDSISVISGINYTKIGEDIPVGERPSAIGIHLDKIFVTNYAADSISVISQKNNSEINISKAS